MRVGLDGFPLAFPRTGIGHYTFELARTLARVAPADQFELVSPAPCSDSHVTEPARDWPANLSIVYPKASSIHRRWWGIGLPLYLKQASLDLFHGTNYDVPLWNRRRNIVTIHDLSILLHPKMHETHLVRRARRRLPLMVRSASTVLTPTESVKREVCEHLRIRPKKVVVTAEAPRESFQRMSPEQTRQTKRRLGVEDGFLLFVGTIEPRKNLLTLVRAFAQVLRHTSHHPQLVIAGAKGWLMDELDRLIRQSGTGDRVLLTGYLPDSDLCALYSSCKIFLYPSLYEGFGLPPLEAMACGAPVIASRIPAIVETLGSAAHLVDPADEQALAGSIIELLADAHERHRLSSVGLQHVKKFSWEQTARLTLEVYDRLLRNPQSDD